MTAKRNALAGFHEHMVSRVGKLQGYVNRVIYEQYKEAQRDRWETEGASEGRPWPQLSQKYARQKLKRYATYPGSGRKLLIATGKLVDAVSGKDSTFHRKLVTNDKMIISVTVPYGSFVNERRPFMRMGEATIKKMRDGLIKYMRGAEG